MRTAIAALLGSAALLAAPIHAQAATGPRLDESGSGARTGCTAAPCSDLDAAGKVAGTPLDGGTFTQHFHSSTGSLPAGTACVKAGSTTQVTVLTPTSVDTLRALGTGKLCADGRGGFRFTGGVSVSGIVGEDWDVVSGQGTLEASVLADGYASWRLTGSYKLTVSR